MKKLLSVLVLPFVLSGRASAKDPAATKDPAAATDPAKDAAAAQAAAPAQDPATSSQASSSAQDVSSSQRARTGPRPTPASSPTPAASAAASDPAMRLYVGTYTNGEAKGIYQYLLRPLGPRSASLQEEHPPTSAVSPSFLAMNKAGTRLVAVNETGDSPTDAPGGISSYAVDKATGEMRLVSRSSSAGPAPCHVSFDRGEKHVLVANYWGGSVTVLPILPDGRLGAATAFVAHKGENATPRDPGAHAHMIEVDPSNRFALVADLGLDKVFVYAYDGEKGTLGPKPREVPLAKGAGPRHLTFDPDGKTVYVLNELNGTVTVFAWNGEDGSMREIQVASTLATGYAGKNSSAEIVVSPDGRFLYASNRGPDDIAIFAIEPQKRTIAPAGRQSTGGRHPRHFAIDPSGAYLVAANRDSDSLNLFRIDPESGLLAPAGALKTPRPVCVLIRKPR